MTDFILLQAEGVVKINSLGKITPEEKKLIEAAIPELTNNIQTVRHFPSFRRDILTRLFV